MMKKIILISIVFLFVQLALANDSRTVIKLNDFDWKWVQKSLVNSQQDYANKGADLDGVELIDSSMLLFVEIDIDQNEFNLIVLDLMGIDNNYEVYANGAKLENELNNENFHTELTSFADEGVIHLALNPITKQTVDDFNIVVSNSSLVLLKGVVLCHIDVKKDEFFGGKLLDVCIQNFIGNDIDGKIYAKLYTVDDWDLVAENNNCAFSRSGFKGNIEINFPDLDKANEGEEFIAEITMVDKDNNESIIDQITVPVRL